MRAACGESPKHRSLGEERDDRGRTPAGLSNVADRLPAIREVVFENKEKSGAEFLGILDRNFEGEEAFHQRLARCPRFGNDQRVVDDIAADVAQFVFEEFPRCFPCGEAGSFDLASCFFGL